MARPAQRAPRVTIVNAPDGVAHTADTVRRMSELARAGAHTYAVRSVATRIVHDVPSKDTTEEIKAIYRWVRDHIRYRFDPRGIEWIQAPDVTLRERAGDCDDITILIAALWESLGHRVQYRTVGVTDGQQSHVHLRAFDGKRWISVDPVLEPKQATTAPRADLGMFGREARGAQRIYNDKGQRMAGINRNDPALQLWQPTVFERPRMRKPRIVPEYRSRGVPAPTPIRQLWENPYDPNDLAGTMGFNLLKSISKVAKVAAPFASFIPGGSAITTGIAIADKAGLFKGGKKAAPAAAARPAAAPRAAVKIATTRPAAGAGSSFGPPAGTTQPQDLSKIVAASGAASIAALDALARQNTAAMNNLMQLAARPMAGASNKKAKPRKRQRWDAKSRRWIVYEQRLGGFKPSITFAMLGVQSPIPTASATELRTLAQRLATSVRTRGYNYDRKLAKEFQTKAGLDPDSAYGGGTAGAVRYFTGSAPPKPLMRPTTEVAYQPATTQQAPAQAITRQQTAAPTTSSAPRVTTTRQPAAPPRIATPSTPTITPDRPVSRRELAENVIRVVRALIAQNGKPPSGAVPGAIAYQTAANIKRDGKYGPQTRATAARDLGVNVNTLPATAFDRPAARTATPTRAPAPRAATPTAPAPAPLPIVTTTPQNTAPIIYDPVSTSARDPGLPRLDDQQPAPAQTQAPQSGTDNKTAWILFGLWYLQRKQTRVA